MRVKQLLSCLLAAALLAACQPTPEEGFVVDRQDGALEEAIAATPAPAARYEAPQRWQETFEVRGQTVRIDMPVEVADASEYPVLTVQRAPFTAQRCVEAVEAYLGAAAWLRETEYSYEEILTDLRVAQRGAAYQDIMTGEVSFVPYEGQQEEIDRLKALLGRASVQKETY